MANILLNTQSLLILTLLWIYLWTSLQLMVISYILSLPCMSFERQSSFSPVSEADVRTVAIRTTSNADNLPVRLWRSLCIITAIFNRSLMSSTFPSQWKTAIIRPLQKRSSRNSDFIPIRNLPALSKCLKRSAHEFSFITSNSLLSIRT